VSERRVFAMLLSLLVTLQVRDVRAQERTPWERPWAPSNSALTVPETRYELGLLAGARYGLCDHIEIASPLILLFVLPQAELKFRFYAFSDFAFAARGRLAYPTPFLHTISRAGALGLLPATTQPPQALQMEIEALGSWLFSTQQVASVWLGLAIAPRTSADDLPLLDFPFLYPRFAPLYTAVVPRAGIGLDGKLVGPLFYGVDLRAYLLPLPDVDGGFAIEQGTSLELRPSSHVAVEVALRTSHARYPIGLRTHFLPLADLKIGF